MANLTHVGDVAIVTRPWLPWDVARLGHAWDGSMAVACGTRDVELQGAVVGRIT